LHPTSDHRVRVLLAVVAIRFAEARLVTHSSSRTRKDPSKFPKAPVVPCHHGRYLHVVAKTTTAEAVLDPMLTDARVRRPPHPRPSAAGPSPAKPDHCTGGHSRRGESALSWLTFLRLHSVKNDDFSARATLCSTSRFYPDASVVRCTGVPQTFLPWALYLSPIPPP